MERIDMSNRLVGFYNKIEWEASKRSRAFNS